MTGEIERKLLSNLCVDSDRLDFIQKFLTKNKNKIKKIIKYKKQPIGKEKKLLQSFLDLKDSLEFPYRVSTKKVFYPSFKAKNNYGSSYIRKALRRLEKQDLIESNLGYYQLKPYSYERYSLILQKLLPKNPKDKNLNDNLYLNKYQWVYAEDWDKARAEEQKKAKKVRKDFHILIKDVKKGIANLKTAGGKK